MPFNQQNLLFSIGCAALIAYLFHLYLQARDRGWSFRSMFQLMSYKMFSRMPTFITHQLPEIAFSPAWPAFAVAAVVFLFSLKASEMNLPGAFMGYVVVGIALLWVIARMAARSVIEVRCHHCYCWVPMQISHCPYCGVRIATRKIHSPPQATEAEEVQPQLGDSETKARSGVSPGYTIATGLVYLAYWIVRLLSGEGGTMAALGIVLLLIVIVGVVGRILSTPADGSGGEKKREFMCTACGKTVAEEDTMCPHCGVSFDDEGHGNEPPDGTNVSG